MSQVNRAHESKGRFGKDRVLTLEKDAWEISNSTVRFIVYLFGVDFLGEGGQQ